MLDNIYKATTETNLKPLSRTLVAKSILKKFQKENPKHSLTQIARLWGISQPTLARIEYQNTEISLEIFLQLLIGSKNISNIAEYIELTDPTVFEALNHGFSQNLDKLHYFISPENVDDLYGNFDHNKKYRPFISKHIEVFGKEEYQNIIIEASTRSGINSISLEKKEIEEKMKVYHLQMLGILIKDKKNIIRTKEMNFRLPFHIVKKNVEYGLKNYQERNSGSHTNWISFQTESLSDDALIKYKEILKRQFVERSNFLEDTKNNGTNAIMTACYSTPVNN